MTLSLSGHQARIVASNLFLETCKKEIKEWKISGLGKIASWTKGSSPSTKAPIDKTIQTLVCHEPHAKKFTPHHPTCTHD
jgi:hypothetical protein